MPARSAIIATRADWSEDCVALCAAQGVDARVVADGLDVLMSALERVPEAIVYDAGLPGVDGLGLCRKLRQQPALAEVELLLLVEGASSAATAACAGLGIACAASPEALIERLGALLSGPDVQAPEPSPPEPSLQPAPQQHGRPKILIVDDDRDVLRGLQVRLRAYDVEVATETGGRNALYAAVELKPDVILTDYSMPDGNAEYFLQRLRAEPGLQEVPIIVMTGWTFDGNPDVAHERDMLGRYGATAYLRKPIEFATVLAELERHIAMPARAKTPA